ncbi:Ku protein [Streptomyces zhihengii]|uniref:Non-homologous end joining protein Ku n=1 Tax=Streptomyces zhihengii TaxID=1818004 RepID=A0ABS2UPI5_9ACTN|nr:Ku protein [Streptomyces zhihengii]MBM9619375.1 Ku protein [Streptomyces zhihengii]
MRSIWNGAISFGLVSIPVKLMNATENHSLSFRQIHAADGGRIRYRKVCELEEKEVSGDEIGKAYEDADGSMIPITDEDLAALPLPTAKTIEIVAFVPASEIDPLQMDTAYYLASNGTPAAKPYTLLREALRRSRKVAVAKFALRGRERLGMLRAVDDVITLHGLLWPDEIREPDTVAPGADVSVRDAELDLADALMDTLGDVDLDSLHDDYREAVEAMIAAKVEGGGASAPAEPADTGGKVIDLMAALESSVRAARKAHGDEEGDGGGGEGAGAEVTPLKRPSGSGASRTSSPGKSASGRAASGKSASGKAASGGAASGGGRGGGSSAKESAAGARKSTAKKTAASSSASPARKSTAKSTGKSTGKPAAKTAAKAASGKAAASSGGRGAAKKSTGGAAGKAAKSSAKPAARKTASRGRSSA